MKLSFNEMLPLEEILGASKSPEEAKEIGCISSGGESDSLEVQLLPECSSNIKLEKDNGNMTSSGSGLMQASIDSLDLKVFERAAYPRLPTEKISGLNWCLGVVATSPIGVW
jgi:hypothetical protein